MDFDKLNSLLIRLFFFGAFVFLALAVIVGIANIFEYAVLQGYSSAARLLELAALLVIVVIALLLRQVRDELKKHPG